MGPSFTPELIVLAIKFLIKKETAFLDIEHQLFFTETNKERG